MGITILRYLQPLIPEYKFYSQRTNTSGETYWQIELTQSTDQFVLDIFFYTRISDNIIFILAPGVLRDRETIMIPYLIIHELILNS